MTKEEKKQAEASKPIEERNYWKLSGSEKRIWRDKRQVNQFNDIVIPILMPFIGLAAIILGVIFLIATNGENSIFAGENAIYWRIASGIVMAIGLGVGIWQFVDMGKKKKGWFINQYYSGNRSGIERQHEAADEERASNDEIRDSSATLDDLDELEEL